MDKEDEMKYDACVAEAKIVAKAKDADYGSCWKAMDLTSIMDEILTRILRCKHLYKTGEDRRQVQEKIDEEFRDMINWCIYGIRKYREKEDLCFILPLD